MNNEVKVLGIFGSPRRGGNTDLLLEEALKGATEEGARVESIHLSDLRITPCRECLACFNDGACVIDDDMQGIYPRLLEANIVILASPIFFYGITGWAKAMVDRCQALWARKYVLHDPSLKTENKRRAGFYISRVPCSRSSISSMPSTRTIRGICSSGASMPAATYKKTPMRSRRPLPPAGNSFQICGQIRDRAPIFLW
jgi:hypothetical protein